MLPTARHGSISFAFLDIDGSRIREMLRQPPCLFGGFVRPKRFISKPLIAQCGRCWRLGHTVGQCQKKADTVVCFICGGSHLGVDHQSKCTKVNQHDGLKCSCPVVCINCVAAHLPGKGHTAKDLLCPLRLKYRDPKSRTGMTSEEESRAVERQTAHVSFTARIDTALAPPIHTPSASPAPEGSIPTPSIPVSNE